jgi:hypothetical protein
MNSYYLLSPISKIKKKVYRLNALIKNLKNVFYYELPFKSYWAYTKSLELCNKSHKYLNIKKRIRLFSTYIRADIGAYIHILLFFYLFVYPRKPEGHFWPLIGSWNMHIYAPISARISAKNKRIQKNRFQINKIKTSRYNSSKIFY